VNASAGTSNGCGLLVRDLEHGYLALDSGDDSTLDDLRGHSMLYRTYE